jgi:acyl-coenzyme A synthetase/AMP-(fatty) acid ligase
VLDDRLDPVSPGEVGHLHIAGVGLSPGYWHDPERTAEAFLARAGPDGAPQRIYRTGDLARVDEEGLFHFVGRADTQVKVRGHRVELGEIEAALQTVKGVSEHAVVAVATSGFEGVVLCCAFVPAPGTGLTAARLRAELGRLLPVYMLPSRWLSLDVLPRNANGKIDRVTLRERFGVGGDRGPAGPMT